MPDTEKAPNVPPFSSGFVPKNNFFSAKYIHLLWIFKSIRIASGYFYFRLFYGGKNDLNIHREIASILGYDKRVIKFSKYTGSIYLKKTPKILLSSVDLDFPRKESKDVYPIGPLIDFSEDEILSKDHRYGVLRNKIKDNGVSVIYCSLGMLVDFQREKKMQLYKKLVKVSSLNSQFIFVLSIGEDMDITDLIPLPTNLYVFRSLPQKDLLKYCSVMINHGGFNSITECVLNNIPVLVYPPSRKADHSSNSARVIFHGIGLRGKIRKDSPQDISEKINHIITHKHYYLNNIQRIKAKIEEKNNSKDVVTIVNSIISSYEKKTKYIFYQTNLR